MKIFVGNLPPSATDDEVLDLFLEYGEVEEVNLIMDGVTGKSRCFGFVTMEDGGEEAVEELHQSDFDGRMINVRRWASRHDRGDGHDRYRRH